MPTDDVSPVGDHSVCASSDEDFKRLFNQLLELKLEEQHKRELRDETTTCAERWEEQTYEVDEQVCESSRSRFTSLSGPVSHFQSIQFKRNQFFNNNIADLCTGACVVGVLPTVVGLTRTFM